MSTKIETQKSVKSIKSTDKKSKKFSDEEKAAMKAHAKELKAEERAKNEKEEGKRAALAAIAGFQEPDRTIAKKLHSLIKANAPTLLAKTWYGMSAYAKDGKAVCYFRDRNKFKERYPIFGFNDSANLDEGSMWPIVFAIKELTVEVEVRIIALVKKAVSENA